MLCIYAYMRRKNKKNTYPLLAPCSTGTSVPVASVCVTARVDPSVPVENTVRVSKYVDVLHIRLVARALDVDIGGELFSGSAAAVELGNGKAALRVEEVGLEGSGAVVLDGD